MAKVDDQTETRLKELADAEMTATRDRLKRRTAAVRDFTTATDRIDEAAATWERIQGEATATKAQAVSDLIGSDMKPAEVAQLLGIDAKQVRSLQAATPSPPSAAPATAKPGSKAKAEKRTDPATPASATQDGQNSAA